MSHKLVKCLAVLAMETIYLVAYTWAQPKPALRLVLDGPFVVCEESDGAHLRVLLPDLSSISIPHQAPRLTTATEYVFTHGGEYEIRNLPSGSMTLQPTSNPPDTVQRRGTCPTQGYFLSLRVPRPDEIWQSKPVPAVVGPPDCIKGKPANWSTRLILRYTAVDLPQVKLWNGQKEVDPQLLPEEDVVTMEFDVQPAGDDPDHDPEAYEAMSKMIGVEGCVHGLQTSSMAPQHKDGQGEKYAKVSLKVGMLGHAYDCHAPLILLCKTCANNP